MSRLLVSPGGRSSVSGLTATVFGGSGFMGRYVVDRLGRIGSKVLVPFRGDGMEVRHLRLCGDVGQITPVPFDLRDRTSIDEAITHSNLVINLIGRHYPTRNFSFEAANVTGPALIAKAAQDAGVQRFVHVSALGASPDSPSSFLRSKAAGEQAVLDAFPGSIIFRPAVSFGWEDRFLNRFVILSGSLPWVPLVNGGKQRVQPVFVENVADAIMSSLTSQQQEGQVYSLGGPDILSLREVVDMIADLTKTSNNFISSPVLLSKMVARVMEMSPWAPLMTRDEVVQQLMDDQVVQADSKGLQELAVTPTSIHDKAKLILGVFRLGGRAFTETTPN